MRTKYNYVKISQKEKSAKILKPLDRETMLSRLLAYVKYEKRYSAINIDTTMKEVKFLLNKYDICRFDIATARRIEDDMTKRGLAPKTIINRLFDFELLAAAHGIKLKIKKPKRIKKKKTDRDYLNIAESRALMEAATNTRDKAIVTLILYCGIRATGLSMITMEDVDLEKRTIKVKFATKNYSEYCVILSKKCVAILQEYLKYRPQDADPQLFLNQYGEKLHSRSITRIVKDIAADAGINKNVFAHMLRTTCGTNMLKSGVPITEVALQLGHTNLNSTMIYLVGSEEYLRKAIDEKFFY